MAAEHSNQATSGGDVSNQYLPSLEETRTNIIRQGYLTLVQNALKAATATEREIQALTDTLAFLHRSQAILEPQIENVRLIDDETFAMMFATIIDANETAITILDAIARDYRSRYAKARKGISSNG